MLGEHSYSNVTLTHLFQLSEARSKLSRLSKLRWPLSSQKQPHLLWFSMASIATHCPLCVPWDSWGEQTIRGQIQTSQRWTPYATQDCVLICSLPNSHSSQLVTPPRWWKGASWMKGCIWLLWYNTLDSGGWSARCGQWWTRMARTWQRISTRHSSLIWGENRGHHIMNDLQKHSGSQWRSCRGSSGSPWRDGWILFIAVHEHWSREYSYLHKHYFCAYCLSIALHTIILNASCVSVTFELNTLLDLSWQATTKSLGSLKAEPLLQVLGESTRTVTVWVIRGVEGVGDVPGVRGGSGEFWSSCTKELDCHKNSDLGSEVGTDIGLNSTTLRL